MAWWSHEYFMCIRLIVKNTWSSAFLAHEHKIQLYVPIFGLLENVQLLFLIMMHTIPSGIDSIDDNVSSDSLLDLTSLSSMLPAYDGWGDAEPEPRNPDCSH